MAQNPAAGVPDFFDTNTAMGLSSPAFPSGGHPHTQSESELDHSHLAFKVVGPIAAGTHGFRQDRPGYVEFLSSNLVEGTHSSVYITANHRESLGQAQLRFIAGPPKRVTLTGIAAPWSRYNNRELNLAAGSIDPRMVGT